MKIAIINGPNLNLLGVREVDIYGEESFASFFDKLQQKFTSVEFLYYQSNVDVELINKIQEVGFIFTGGYTHTSVAIGDAIAAITSPVIEVHISNIFGREEVRKLSHVSAKAKGVISGLGLKGYELAIDYFTK